MLLCHDGCVVTRSSTHAHTGVAELGVSYEKLASSVAPGRIIKVADDGLSIKVTEQLDAKRLRGM